MPLFMLKNGPMDDVKPSGSMDMPFVKDDAFSGKPVIAVWFKIVGPLGARLCRKLLAREIG